MTPITQIFCFSSKHQFVVKLVSLCCVVYIQYQQYESNFLLLAGATDVPEEDQLPTSKFPL